MALIMCPHRFGGIEIAQLQGRFIDADYFQRFNIAIEFTQIQQAMRDTGFFKQGFVAGSAMFQCRFRLL